MNNKSFKNEEEIILLQRAARFSPKILWATLGTLTLYSWVVLLL